MKAYIYLEDGTKFTGKSFGAKNTIIGELVFNTGMTGYQEILTDPSYAEQVVMMTYPLIGNYGINNADFESNKTQVKGFVVKEYSEIPSHYDSNLTISEYLKNNNIPAVCGVDTRMLTKKIREKGSMNCIITTDSNVDFESIFSTYQFPKDIAQRVSMEKKTIIEGGKIRIGILDLGVKNSIINQIKSLGCTVIIYPYNTSHEEILADNLNVLLLSNGPGNPKDNVRIIDLTKELLGKINLWGICLGHQILSLALGADTYKLKFGHRGSNHPVLNVNNSKVIISSQNHGYAVKENTLTSSLFKTFININDNTIEGFESPKYKIKAVQFHPEEGPGPVDGEYIFKEWYKTLKAGE